MQRKKYISEEKEDNILQQVVTKYLPYWPMFIIAGILGIATAFVYLRYTIPVYEANATLIIKDEKKGNEESKMMESLDPISSKKIVENETEVLQSRRLMNDVVNELGLYAPVYEKGDIKTLSAYISSPIVVKSPNPDSLIPTQGEDKIFFEIDSSKNQIVLNQKDRYDLNKLVNTSYGKLIFSPNPYYQKREKPAKPLFFVLINPRDLVPGLLGSLNA